MNVIILAQNKAVLEQLNTYIPKLSDLNILYTFNSGMTAITEAKKSNVDLLFLESQLEDMTGFEFLSMLENPPMVIMISPNKEDAFKAFEYNVLDFVSSELEFPRFMRAIDRAQIIYQAVEQERNHSTSIFFRSELKTIKINLDEILYVEALADYVIIVTDSNKYVVHTTMKSLENKLMDKNFIRVHRSYIVNISKINYIEGSDIFIGMKTIPIGASHKDNLYENIKFLF